MEITGKYAEITWLKEKSHSSEILTPKTKDIVLYHDYSDYTTYWSKIYSNFQSLPFMHGDILWP